jgi:cytidylate kinase
LARELGYLFFDTGVLYRALTIAAQREGIDVSDGVGLADVGRRMTVDVLPADKPPGYVVLLEGEDITAALRSDAVDSAVAQVSRHAEVRDVLLETQRRIGADTVVMVGRDIGTVVLPDAELKIYLDASPQERARRRFRELLARGVAASFQAILNSVAERDAQDAGRSTAPLAKATDAVIVDTDRCDVDEVTAHLAGLVRRWPDALTTRGGPSPCAPDRGADARMLR